MKGNSDVFTMKTQRYLVVHEKTNAIHVSLGTNDCATALQWWRDLEDDGTHRYVLDNETGKVLVTT